MKHIVSSDVGVVRSENQDRAAVFSNGNATLAVLCDGMGGHMGGSYASSITIATFEKEFQKGVKQHKVSDWFFHALKRAKKEMTKFAASDKQLLDMGTTLTAAMIFEDEIYVLNIGDSRTYAYNGLLHLITRDHNLRNHYIDKYGYSPEEAAKLVGAMALTSALGPQKTSNTDSKVIPREGIKQIILTSDGVHDYVSKPNFERILSSKDSIEDKSKELIKQAIKSKSSDNLTVVIVDLEEKW